MKSYLLTLTFIFLSVCSFAQSKEATLKIKAAVMALSKEKFTETLKHLKEAERLDKSSSPQILYLKIIAQRALLPEADDPAFYNHMDQFDKLEELRDHCKLYLSYAVPSKTSAAAYKKILAVQQSLRPYPVARVQFDENMHLRNSGKQP